jgi:hypothetical protein
MSRTRLISLLAFGLLTCPQARAGLHYSGEEINPLPSQWRGFLLDQRQLRALAVPAGPKSPPSALLIQYRKSLEELEKAARARALSADEWADLGALHVRLGDPGKALNLLREAQRKYPRHYRITANLGTVWHLLGDLEQAETCLREAVRLAPGNLQRAEEFHLRLVLSRRRELARQGLDPLLELRFVNDRGEYEPGNLAAAERKKLPAGAVADLQMLALWLPADGRLLWLLAELAAVHGDLRTAAAIMDGCIGDFALRAPELRKHRLAIREALDRQAKDGPPKKGEHEGHVGPLKTRSTRPLLDRFSLASLPPIRPDGANSLPWAVVTRTTVDRAYKPTFPAYLKELEGREVELSGFMQPLGDDPEMNAFLLIEYPVGCWYCEVPEVTAMVLVELPPGKSLRFSREMVQVTGKLKLNATDPEDFLYKVNATKAGKAD